MGLLLGFSTVERTATLTWDRGMDEATISRKTDNDTPSEICTVTVESFLSGIFFRFFFRYSIKPLHIVSINLRKHF